MKVHFAPKSKLVVSSKSKKLTVAAKCTEKGKAHGRPNKQKAHSFRTVYREIKCPGIVLSVLYNLTATNIRSSLLLHNRRLVAWEVSTAAEPVEASPKKLFPSLPLSFFSRGDLVFKGGLGISTATFALSGRLSYQSNQVARPKSLTNFLTITPFVFLGFFSIGQCVSLSITTASLINWMYQIPTLHKTSSCFHNSISVVPCNNGLLAFMQDSQAQGITMLPRLYEEKLECVNDEMMKK